MTEAVQVALIVALGPVVVGLVNMYQANKAAVLALKLAVESNKQIIELHVAINSKMDSLLALTARESMAQGKAEGLAEGATVAKEALAVAKNIIGTAEK